MLEIIQGVFIVIFSSSIGITTLIGFLLSYVTVKPFSIGLHRKIVSKIANYAYLLGTFVTQYSSSMKIKLHGDDYPKNSSSLVIMNHSSRTDWLITLAWLTIGHPFPGNVKYVAKRSIASVPIFGWALRIAEFVFLAQKWSEDEERFKKELKSLRDYEEQTGFPLTIVLFPEGTLSEPDKILVSQDYAKEKGLPVFENVLLPRFRGFREMVPILRHKIDYIVDTTLIFDPEKPNFYDVMVGKAKGAVHFHTRVHPISTIPENPNEIEKWLLDRWVEKENLLQDSKNSNIDGISAQSGKEFRPKFVRRKIMAFFSIFVLGYLSLILFVRRFKHGVLDLFLAEIFIAFAALGAIIYNLIPRTAKRKAKPKYGATSTTENNSEIATEA